MKNSMLSRDKETIAETAKILFADEDQVSASKKKYNAILLNAAQVFSQRNKLYGDAFIFIGLLGNLAVLIGDMIRLRYMVFKSKDNGLAQKEQVKDKLIDVINQAALCYICIEDNNLTGDSFNVHYE